MNAVAVMIEAGLFLFFASTGSIGQSLNTSDHQGDSLERLLSCLPCNEAYCNATGGVLDSTINTSADTALPWSNGTVDEPCGHREEPVLDDCGCCLVCLRKPNETCGGKSQRLGICQSGSTCWPILPPKGVLLTGSEIGQCIELMDPACPTPVESKGCNLHAKRGCLCSNVMACRRVEFQYEDEDECHKDWRKLKAMWQHDCLKARCDVVFQPHCPPDSVFAPAPSPEPPECCRKPGTCQCAPQACQNENILKSCPPGQDLVLTKKATGQPGYCCDEYECHARGDDCNSAICPSVEAVAADEATSSGRMIGKDDDDCPPDSFRPLTIHGKDRCCPVKDECRCRPGLCQPVNCPDGVRLVVRKKGAGVPGACCDEFECIEEKNMMLIRRPSLCDYEGKQYETGDTWRPTPCVECTCNDGVNLCRKLECPTSTCTRLAIPHGECCPVCIGCTSEDGEQHNVTDEWQKDDCTSCSCEPNGQVRCQKQMCKVECDHPVKIPGECCPKCDKPVIITLPQLCPRIELCPLRCEYGLKRSDRGCFVCECQIDSSVAERDRYGQLSTMEPFHPLSSHRRNCSLFDGGSCLKKCAHGYEHDERGCPMCKCNSCPPMHQCYKHCLHGFQTNIYGCIICKCKGMNLESASLESPRLGSGSSLHDLSSSFDLSACQSQTGGLREHGEWWFDSCRHCYCDNGSEYCSVLICPPLNCTHPVYETGDCCPRCPGSSQEGLVQRLVCHAPGSGRSYVEGEYWDLDACIRCTCHVGHILCHKKLCPPAPCANPTTPAGQCCPICEDLKLPELRLLKNVTFCQSDAMGSAYVDGSIWKASPCQSCLCKEGQTVCHRQQCPLIGCHGRFLQLKHECCPICTGNLENGACKFSDSMLYSVGEEWRDGPCRNCSCVGDGETLCTQVECPRCFNATPVEGQCCQLCNDNDSPNANLDWNAWTRATPISAGTGTPELTGSRNSTSTLVVFSCLVGIVAVVVAIVLIICWYRRRNRHRPHSNGVLSFLGKKSDTGGARLTNFPGYDPSKSTPAVTEGRNNYVHEQTKSLLSMDGFTNGDVGKEKNKNGRCHPDILLSGNNTHCAHPYDQRSNKPIKNRSLLNDYDVNGWDVEKV